MGLVPTDGPLGHLLPRRMHLSCTLSGGKPTCKPPSHETGAEGHIYAPKISIRIHFLHVNPKDTFFKILSPSRIGLMQLDCILGINPGGCCKV